MAELGLRAGAPSLDLVSCSPGQQLEEQKREGRKRKQRISAGKVGGDGEDRMVEVWKEDSGKAIRFL